MPVTKPRKPSVKHKPSHVAQVLYECGGITKDAAKKLLMTDATVRAYIKKYPVCREAREGALSDLKDIATDTLISWVKKKDKQATFFVLSRFRQKDGTWTSKQDESEPDTAEEPLEFVSK